jgi:hypothetical protein
MPSGTADDACAREVLVRLGRRAWRRPLAEAEVTLLVGIAKQGAMALGDFHKGLEFPVAALIQSPSFLFRAELGEADPTVPGRLRYDSWEMASRVSFLLWNSIPDDALLDAAERGELITDAGLATQVDRLLADPRARDGVRQLFTELFELDRLDELVKDPKLFVNTSPEIGPAARTETLMGLEDLIFERKGDYRDLFTTRRTFLDRKLASIYDVPAPAREGFGAHEWPEDSERVGLLGQLSVLALHAHSTSSSATRRGKFVRRVLLCVNLLPPPTDVDTSIPEPSGTARTLRDRVKEHLENPSCAVCHKVMDPIGLGLENFDGLGQWRLTDNDAPIDASGELDGTAFTSPRELAEAVRNHPNLAPCFVKSVYRFATGHLEESGEAEMLKWLAEDFAGAGHRVLPLIRQVALSPGFRLARAAKEGP